jgi:hypothetical protein
MKENLTKPIKALEIGFILSLDVMIYTYTYLLMTFV